MKGRPEELRGRKASLFVARCPKGGKVAGEITELAAQGATNRFEWDFPSELREPTPFALHVVAKMLSKQHGISAQHQKVRGAELDDLLEIHDHCTMEDRDISMSELESIARAINKLGFPFNAASPLNLISLAVGRAMMTKPKGNVAAQSATPTAITPTPICTTVPAMPPWVSNPQWWNWGNPKNEEKNRKGNGKEKKDKNGDTFDKTALLKLTSAWKVTGAAGNAVDIKTLLYCLWKDSKNGCTGGKSNQQRHFSHDKPGRAKTFVINVKMAAGAAFEAFKRWAVANGYVFEKIEKKEK